jgi:3-methyl-2-oxobutanoate hydroxymethyltransferase
MSYLSENKEEKRKKIRIHHFSELKNKGIKISSLTCYDSSFAAILEKTNLHFVLVGDSMGSVIQGAASTLNVTLENIAYHVKCVASQLRTPFLVADMPFATAGIDKKDTYLNATKLIQAGAEGVKIEGATKELLEDIAFLTTHGIPVMGHIGLMPQSLHAVGGYKYQGKTESSRMILIDQAKKLQDAGCFSIVLEMVEPALAQEISTQLSIPTIGIGSGNNCDGNILVLQDMLGLNSEFKPKFLKHYAHLNETITNAVEQYCLDVSERKSEP